jgi:branched-chain amino acid transport system substrate-binding protein
VEQGLENAAKSAGLKVIRLSFISPCEDAAEILKMAPMRDADVVVGIGNFEDDTKIVSQFSRTKPLVTIAAGSTAFGRSLGGNAEGVMGPSQWEPGVHHAPSKGPDSEWFTSHFEDTFGADPEYTAAQAFATGIVVQEAIRHAGGLQDERLRKAAASLDFRSFYGAFRIDPKNGCQIGHESLLIRWHGGKKVILWPPEVIS